MLKSTKVNLGHLDRRDAKESMAASAAVVLEVNGRSSDLNLLDIVRCITDVEIE